MPRRAISALYRRYRPECSPHDRSRPPHRPRPPPAGCTGSRRLPARGDGRCPCPAPARSLVRTIWLSLDPYMRGRMDEGPSATPRAPGSASRCGARCVGKVLESRDPAFAKATSSRAMAAGRAISCCRPASCASSIRQQAPLSTALGMLGMPGMTAYTGLHGDRPPASRARPWSSVRPRVPVGAARRPDRQAEGLRVVGDRRRAGEMPLRHRASSASTSASTATSPISPGGCAQACPHGRRHLCRAGRRRAFVGDPAA